jgi:hypothetical protein
MPEMWGIIFKIDESHGHRNRASPADFGKRFPAGDHALVAALFGVSSALSA